MKSSAKESNLPSYEHYFSDPALTKAYYIPTDPIKLTDLQKKTALSPQKIPEKESGTPQPITPETKAYLRKTNNIFDQNKFLPSHETPSPSSTALFNESWPSTVKSSSHDDQSNSKLVDKSNTLSRIEETAETTRISTEQSADDSIISKYLRRFRHDPPRKRSERKPPTLSEFWWGDRSCNATLSETESRAAATCHTSSDKDSSDLTTPKSSSTITSKLSNRRIDLNPTTPKTKALVDKTNQIINKSELSSNSELSPPVSSAGINSKSTSNSSPPTSVNSGAGARMYHSTPEEETAKRPVLHRTAAEQRILGNRGGSQRQSAVDENDILYQWRLKRKMESAQRRVAQAEQMIRLGDRLKLTQQAVPSTKAALNMMVGPVDHDDVETHPVRDESTHHRTHQTPACKSADRPKPTLLTSPAAGPGEANTNSSTTRVLVERTIQTDPEIRPITTQTTPTIDPLTELNKVVTKSQQQVTPSQQRMTRSRNTDNVQVGRSTTQQAEGPDGDGLRRRRDVKHTKNSLSHSLERSLPQSPVHPLEKIPHRTIEASTPVSKAINQIASQRLFAPDSSEVSSLSVDDKTVHAADGDKSQLEEPEEDATLTPNDSDDEFSDDSLLQGLRDKRSAILDKLREIDDMMR